MATSCQKLAARYAALNNIPIPAKNASNEEKSAFLLQQTWGCVNSSVAPFTTAFHEFKPNDPNDWCLLNNNPAAPGGSTTSTFANRPAMVNTLQEKGFLAFVNEVGLKCVNQVTGVWIGLNPKTGLVNSPSATVSAIQPTCVAPCMNVNSNSEICIQCVAQTVADNVNMCQAFPRSSVEDDAALIQEAINCQECIGNQSALSNTETINNMWNCITGTVQPPISTEAIVLIVVFGVMLVVVAIILGVYFGYIEPKIKRRLAESQQLRDRGVNPDDI